MKLIDDLTKDEIINIKTDEVERIILLHLANAGIKLPKKPVEPTYNVLPEKDKTIYEVKGLSMAFEKKEVAEDIAKTIRNNFSSVRKVKYNYDLGSEYEYDEPYKDEYEWRLKGSEQIVVTEKKLYSTDLYLQIKEKLNQNSQLKKAYDKQKEEYDKIETSAKETVDYVWDKVNEIKEEQMEKERKLKLFQEYLTLADKNKDIAWKFMKKAYTVNQEEEDYINANIKL